MWIFRSLNGMSPFFRLNRLLWWIILICYCNVYPVELMEELDYQCPVYCKCTTIASKHTPADLTNHPTRQSLVQEVSDVQITDEVMSDCWIPANLVELKCGSRWKILHLQILSDVSASHKGSVPDDKAIDASVEATINSGLFKQCSSLSRLAIWPKSQINSLPQYILRPLIGLTRLVIKVPTLQSLPDHFLAFLPKLNFLMITKCSRLSKLTRSIFEPCPKSLKQVELNGNGFNGSLPAGVFRDCQFHTLWLNENQLTRLEFGSLTGLDVLSHLRLDHNHLTGSLEIAMSYRPEMHSSAMSATHRLRSLDLSFNRLTIIEGNLWSGVCERTSHQVLRKGPQGLCYLEDLNLSNNQLHWLGSQAFRQLPRLRKLLLDGNQKLYSSDALASLSVSLYTLNLIENQAMDTILLSLPSALSNISHTGSVSTLPLVHQLQTFNVCEPNMPHISLFPPTLKEILQILNSTTCRRDRALENVMPKLITTEVDIRQDIETRNHMHSDNASQLRDEVNTSERVQLSVPYESRLQLFALILIPLLVGVFFGCLLTGCIYMIFDRKRQDRFTNGGLNNRDRDTESHNLLHFEKEHQMVCNPTVYDVLSTPLPVRKTMSSKCASPSTIGTRDNHDSRQYPIMYYPPITNHRSPPSQVVPPRRLSCSFYPNTNPNSPRTHASAAANHVNLLNWQLAQAAQQPHHNLMMTNSEYPQCSNRTGGSTYSLVDDILPRRMGRQTKSEISATRQINQCS